MVSRYPRVWRFATEKPHGARGHVLLRRQKNTFDIQIENLLERGLWMLIKRTAPGRTSIGEQDVDMVSRLSYLASESLNLCASGSIRGNGDGLRIGSLVRQGIERGNGGDAGVGFARGDIDLGAAGLQEARRERSMAVVSSGKRRTQRRRVNRGLESHQSRLLLYHQGRRYS